MYKYKLVKKINPQDKAAPKKWYAIPISEVPQTVKAMTRAATENTVSFKSDGVEDITDFNAGAMIKNPRIIFTPSKEFRESVLQGIQFQNAGVLDEGISYASLSDYKKAKGITSGGSDDSGGSSIGGGGTGEDGEGGFS